MLASRPLTIATSPLSNADPEEYSDLDPVPVQAMLNASVGRFEARRGSEFSRGTGQLIGPHHVLTSAHVLWDSGAHDWVTNPELGWSVTFTPAQTSAIGLPSVNVELAFCQNSYSGDFDFQHDVVLAVLEPNDITAAVPTFGIWYDVPSSFYERRPLGLFGYPSKVAFSEGNGRTLHMAFGDFRGFPDAHTALYGNRTFEGMSGARVAAFPGGLNGDVGLHHISFVHAGRVAGSGEDRIGVRFNSEKANGLFECVCASYFGNDPLPYCG